MSSPALRTYLLIAAVLLLSATPVIANTIEDNPHTKQDLEWGTVLFEYYQKDYFNALIEYEYANTIGNPIAQSRPGNLLQGGMLLSYGLADQAKSIFDRALAEGADQSTRNRAWYYLANLFYHKSEPAKAFDSLSQIQGDIPDDLHPDYHYLATLLNNSAAHLDVTESIVNSLPEAHPHYPYILFNLAIQHLREGSPQLAAQKLQRVVTYQNDNEELATLADRAKHGLAQLFLQQGQNAEAWQFLTAIRTTGLYSNRALLTYAWTAIKMQQYNDAVAALEILNTRSIALPEVQEAKVLLAHLYEQEGSPRKALKANLLAIEAFDAGVKKVDEARGIIAKQDVPREFIQNLDVMVDDTDWFASEPSVDYQKLTPFLIDLMSSKVVNETLRELSDLYAIEKNLRHWKRQTLEHQAIIQSAQKKSYESSDKSLIEKSKQLSELLKEKKSQLKLHALTLTEEQQKLFKALIENIERELSMLQSRVTQMQQVERPYQQPASYLKEVKQKHASVDKRLAETRAFIAKLEPVVRSLVNAELDKHEERMRYYWAQSRLAKARLYDTTLMELDKAKSRQEQQPETSKESGS